MAFTWSYTLALTTLTPLIRSSIRCRSSQTLMDKWSIFSWEGIDGAWLELPFDFCGSVYLLDSVTKVMDAMDDISKISKPNTFEYFGNLAIKNHALASTLCLCLNEPVMTVITVNKVQDVYDTPVYEYQCEDVLEVMNQYMREGRNLTLKVFMPRLFSTQFILETSSL